MARAARAIRSGHGRGRRRGRRAAAWLLLALTAAAAGADMRPRPLPGTRAEAATLIVQGIEGGSLPFAAVALTEAARAAPGAGEPPELRLPIAFEVAEAALDAATLEFYAYAMTGSGAVVAHFAAALDLEPGRPAGGAGARLIATLDLPPGSYSLRFLLLEPASHRFALRRASINLPAAANAPALARPALDDRCTGWTVASTPAAPRSKASALPVLLTGSRVELSSALRAGATDPIAATVRLEPVRAAGAESHAFAADLVGGDRDAGDGRSLGVAFELPAIARGVYRLTVAVERDASRLISPPVEVWVVGPGDLDSTSPDPCARTWSAVVAHAAGPPVGPGDLPARADAATTSTELVKLQPAYLEVLRQLATTGDLDAAAELLGELEHGLANLHSGLQRLLRRELDVARRLAGREPEILPALMMLHHQAYLAHSRRGRFPLAGHSTRVVRALGELMVDRRQPEESQALAAGILTSLAEHGHRKRMFVPGRLLLEDALEMEPGNQAALLLLAVNYEWFGRYEEAGRLLERLVRVAATNSEARVRLGIMRSRTGDAERAERDFRHILREGAPDWLLSLAYQALAELMSADERHAEAVELLREGRARLASDQALHLLSAHALDRAGRSAEARRLLDQLPIDGALATARFRYGESLTSPLTALRDDVSRGVAVRLPMLARALEPESPG